MSIIPMGYDVSHRLVLAQVFSRLTAFLRWKSPGCSSVWHFSPQKNATNAFLGVFRGVIDGNLFEFLDKKSR